MSITAMKAALEAMIDVAWDEEGYCMNPDLAEAADALRAAISEQEKCEPFGVWHQADDPDECDFFLGDAVDAECCDRCIPLFTHPAPVEKCDHVPVTTFGGDYCIKCDAPVEKAEPVAMFVGWQLVPVKPTREMLFAADAKACELADRPKGFWYAGLIYKAMLQAAPKPGEMK